MNLIVTPFGGVPVGNPFEPPDEYHGMNESGLIMDKAFYPLSRYNMQALKDIAQRGEEFTIMDRDRFSRYYHPSLGRKTKYVIESIDPSDEDLTELQKLKSKKVKLRRVNPPANGQVFGWGNMQIQDFNGLDFLNRYYEGQLLSSERPLREEALLKAIDPNNPRLNVMKKIMEMNQDFEYTRRRDNSGGTGGTGQRKRKSKRKSRSQKKKKTR